MSYRLDIITPSSRIEKDVEGLRAEDSSGSFGILGRHHDFLTALKPCIIIYRQRGKEGFVAVDGGILRVEAGSVTVASREAVESGDFMELKNVVRAEFYRKEEKEAAFMDLLSNMEKLLIDNLIKFEKG